GPHPRQGRSPSMACRPVRGRGGRVARRTAAGGRPMIDRARSTIVDCGYREAAERRERLVAHPSPAVRARSLGTRPAYGADDAAPTATGGAQGEVDRLQREIRELALVQKAMQGELEALRRQQAMAPASRAIADVARRFVADLAHVGYRIKGDPVTLTDLQSPRRA